ncbi:hypothetical protein KSS87_000449, partial [Heliosperma pusillum]
MSAKNPWKTQNHTQFSLKNSWKSMVFYVMISLVLILCYLSPFSFPTLTTYEKSSNISLIPIISSVSSNSSSTSSLPLQGLSNVHDVFQEAKVNVLPTTCDYTNGEWIKDKKGPLYNGSTCGTIKDGQNCMTHGRPDIDYLHWRWKPRRCDLSRFDPQSFLQIFDGKHIAFVGDSLARNQLESLLCMLSSVSTPNLVYLNGDENKFRRWNFGSHNVTVSIYWSPFLVKGVEKSKDRDYNTMYLDSVDEKWGSDLDSIDMLVLSIGHWFLLRGIYMDGKTELGCHAMESVNCTEIGFYDAFGKAFNTSLKTIIQRKGLKSSGIDVVVTTFSPHHFEGDWDKFGACSKTMPYKEGEKKIDGMNDILRRIAVEEVEKARSMLKSNVRVAALDVTKLSLLRPDGHPGPYMYYNPFGDGIKERVH